MKPKILFKSLFTAGLLSVTLGLHATEPVTKPAQENATPEVVLYESEAGKTVTQKLPINTHLIKIYQKKDWIKVANPNDGSVGWINQTQYQKAVDEFNQPNVQEVFISKSVDKNNKPEINVVAYKNGKPVSQQEANAMYEKIKQEQKTQEDYWKKWNAHALHFRSTPWPGLSISPFFIQPFPAPIFILQ